MNWKTLLSEIFEAGKTQVAVAEYCGCGQSTISDLYREKNHRPGFEVGQKLIELHKSIKRRKK